MAKELPRKALVAVSSFNGAIYPGGHKTVIARWRIKASETSRLLAMLPELAEKTRSEPGNVLYTIFQSASDPRDLVLHEEYVDDAAADAHRQSEHYQRIVADEIVPHLELRDVVVVNRLV